MNIKGECRLITSQIDQKQNQSGFSKTFRCTSLYWLWDKNWVVYQGVNEVQLLWHKNATNDFSKDNLLGEGGYGHVYKGVLKDGQQIAAKVRKQESYVRERERKGFWISGLAEWGERKAIWS